MYALEFFMDETTGFVPYEGVPIKSDDVATQLGCDKIWDACELPTTDCGPWWEYEMTGDTQPFMSSKKKEKKMVLKKSRNKLRSKGLL